MDLERTISQYVPDERAAALVRATKIVLLVGISGAGKDTIKRRILEKDDFSDIVSHTTREPRINNGVLETRDVDYHFIDESTAQSMLENHDFIEAKYVHGTIYGTSLKALQSVHDAGKIAITDVDVQGVEEYRKMSNDIVAIFIIPPSFSVWQERFSERYDADSQDRLAFDWNRRRQSAVKELELALERPYRFIVNDDLDYSVAVIEKIARDPQKIRSKDESARQIARTLLEDIRASLV